MIKIPATATFANITLTTKSSPNTLLYEIKIKFLCASLYCI